MIKPVESAFRSFFEFNSQSRRFFMTIVAIGFALDGVYGVLLNLYLLRLGYDALYIGQVNSVGLLTFAVVSLPAGIFGTWWTSIRVLRFGAATFLIGTILLPLGEFTPLAWHEL